MYVEEYIGNSFIHVGISSERPLLEIMGRLNILGDFSAEAPQVQMMFVQPGYFPGMVRTLEHALNQEGLPNAL